MEQLEKNSGTVKHCNNVLDVMDTQNVAPPRQKEVAVLSTTTPGSVLDKPCTCLSQLFCFVFHPIFVGSTSMRIMYKTSHWFNH